ncbi:4Fe-4S single cluster domain-containing protein [Dethiosulfatibacter aminovorans DSM 17477]|uniref:4Fe-4S single cluster domain-containing protein n=1 Tax=Dethiosulfatibacter aminovorans DSM 17477 TaxID=1121476 RepID=A0A1M6MH94_9FIRM|nr:permease [Dethiosulfatibacter aminovorans]SHJ82818.1 4Fe-4S single cluster domain-containing protein [Dethiosulfatibacter aminovorans DSM 17477]
MNAIMKKNKLFIIIIIIYAALMIFKNDMASTALGNSMYYLIEMTQILPVIFMLTVAIDVLIPKEWIVKRLGSKSGIAGAGLALAFGSLSAGPIYAAFPIAKTLHKKGASAGNVVIILSAWAVIKVPMLANEAKFLGPDFMAVRWLLTVLFIFAIALIMEKLHIHVEHGEESIKEDIVVKKDYCIGCTACAKGMPEVFGMKDGKAYVIRPDTKLALIDEDKKEKLYKEAGKCPPRAIEIKG